MSYFEVPAITSQCKAAPGICTLFVVNMDDLVSIPSADSPTHTVSDFPSLLTGKNYQPHELKFKQSDIVENATENDLIESVVNALVSGDDATKRATFRNMYGCGNKYSIIIEYPREAGETEPKRLIGFNYEFDTNFTSGKSGSSEFKGYTGRFFKFGDFLYTFTAQFPGA